MTTCLQFTCDKILFFGGGGEGGLGQRYQFILNKNNRISKRLVHSNQYLIQQGDVHEYVKLLP